eukprot:GHVL01008835.1.p1 GENE.GHVL01008835.1~~GHVL01008835.1.p1  ORF type:complete len:418 (+),score=61.26 GHVL01008835.1:1775-3028(+)
MLKNYVTLRITGFEVTPQGQKVPIFQPDFQIEQPPSVNAVEARNEVLDFTDMLCEDSMNHDRMEDIPFVVVEPSPLLSDHCFQVEDVGTLSDSNIELISQKKQLSSKRQSSSNSSPQSRRKKQLRCETSSPSFVTNHLMDISQSSVSTRPSTFSSQSSDSHENFRNVSTAATSLETDNGDRTQSSDSILMCEDSDPAPVPRGMALDANNLSQHIPAEDTDVHLNFIDGLTSLTKTSSPQKEYVTLQTKSYANNSPCIIAPPRFSGANRLREEGSFVVETETTRVFPSSTEKWPVPFRCLFSDGEVEREQVSHESERVIEFFDMDTGVQFAALPLDKLTNWSSSSVILDDKSNELFIGTHHGNVYRWSPHKILGKPHAPLRVTQEPTTNFLARPMLASSNAFARHLVDDLSTNPPPTV